MLFRVASLAEAIEIANDTPFGLGASVWTNEHTEQEQLIAELECGQVFVNAIVSSDPRLPFGGIKRSGYGRELSAAGMREFLNAKTVVIAEDVQQTEIPFEPAVVALPLETPEADPIAIPSSPYDSSQFREAFRTALADSKQQAEDVTDPEVRPRNTSRISGFRRSVSGIRDPE
jgi:hypothetical protein